MITKEKTKSDDCGGHQHEYLGNFEGMKIYLFHQAKIDNEM